MTSSSVTSRLHMTMSCVRVFRARPVELRSPLKGRYVGTTMASNRARAGPARDSSRSPACDSVFSGTRGGVTLLSIPGWVAGPLEQHGTWTLQARTDSLAAQDWYPHQDDETIRAGH